MNANKIKAKSNVTPDARARIRVSRSWLTHAAAPEEG